MKIEMKAWKIIDKEGQKVVAGSFCVKQGDKEIASKEFNDGYGTIDINFPPSLLVKAEEIDKEVREAVIANFGITETS